MCSEGWVEQDVSGSTRALWLLAFAPGAIWLFVAVPRATMF